MSLVCLWSHRLAATILKILCVSKLSRLRSNDAYFEANRWQPERAEINVLVPDRGPSVPDKVSALPNLDERLTFFFRALGDPSRSPSSWIQCRFKISKLLGGAPKSSVGINNAKNFIWRSNAMDWSGCFADFQKRTMKSIKAKSEKGKGKTGGTTNSEGSDRPYIRGRETSIIPEGTLPLRGRPLPNVFNSNSSREMRRFPAALLLPLIYFTVCLIRHSLSHTHTLSLSRRGRNSHWCFRGLSAILLSILGDWRMAYRPDFFW